MAQQDGWRIILKAKRLIFGEQGSEVTLEGPGVIYIMLMILEVGGYPGNRAGVMPEVHVRQTVGLDSTSIQSFPSQIFTS